MICGGSKNVVINELDNTADFLVIFGKTDMEVSTIIEKVKCKTVVFASTCPHWMVKKWIQDLNSIDINIHNVKEDGSYIVNL
jgi:predicted TIM-barrel fold metal-dependent hydrolase